MVGDAAHAWPRSVAGRQTSWPATSLIATIRRGGDTHVKGHVMVFQIPALNAPGLVWHKALRPRKGPVLFPVSGNSAAPRRDAAATAW